MVLMTCFFNVEKLDPDRMLFFVYISNTNSCKILNKIDKNQLYMSWDTLIFIIYPVFGINIEIMYKISSTMPFSVNFWLKLAENCKNLHLCFHGNHGSNVGIGEVSTADINWRILFSRIVYVKCLPVMRLQYKNKYRLKVASMFLDTL